MIHKRLSLPGLLALLLTLSVWLIGPTQLQAESQALSPIDSSPGGPLPEAAGIEVDPAEFVVTRPVGTVRTYSFAINNSGTSDLVWTIDEEPAVAPALPGALPEGALPLSSASPADNTWVPEVVTSASQCAQYENYAGAEPAGYADYCTVSTAPPRLESVSAPQGPTDIAYAHDISYITDNFVSFTLDDFPGQTVLGQNNMALFGYAFDRSGTILYALDNTGKQLGVVDTTDGTFTPIGPSTPLDGHTLSGISIHPVTGEAYVSTTNNIISALYTIDLTTGELTLIDTIPELPLLIEISFSPEGVLYGHDIGEDAIYIIDTETLDVTEVGPTGYFANFAQGMDFDWSDGTLYIFLYMGSGANVFGTVDLDTGAVTPLDVDDPEGEFEGAIPNKMPCSLPSDIPWVSVSPTSGTTAPGSSSEVLVTFDTTGLIPGNTYTGSLCIDSNDPDAPWTELPLSLTVDVHFYHYLPVLVNP